MQRLHVPAEVDAVAPQVDVDGRGEVRGSHTLVVFGDAGTLRPAAATRSEHAAEEKAVGEVVETARCGRCGRSGP